MLVRYVLLQIICFCFLLAGCAPYRSQNLQSASKPTPELLAPSDLTAANAQASLPNAINQAAKMPWELWNSGQSADGSLVRNFQILSGDRFREQGLLKAAADQYLNAAQQGLPAGEQDSAFLRLASLDLIAGNSQKVLLQLSDYFKRKGVAVAEVSPHFALLFSYAYGTLSDYEQSLAWFSQALRISAVDNRVKSSATNGVATLIATAKAEDFEKIKQQWLTDLHIGYLIQKEIDRRMSGGAVQTPAVQGKFWLVPIAAAAPLMSVQPAVRTSGVRVVGLLPLTGTYTQLGVNVKRGLELALAGEQKSGIDLSFVDTKEDPNIAVNLVRQEIAKGGNPIFVGPILAPAANSVAAAAAQLGATVVSLTKSENFSTGRTVLRLGPTASSQLGSLVEEVAQKTGARKFGILYPRTTQGEELLEVFNRQLAQRRLPLFYSRVYESQDFSSFIEVGQELDTKDIDALFIADDLNAASRLTLSLSENARKKVRILGSPRWDNQSELARYSQALDGIIFVGAMKRPAFSPIAKSFFEAYQRTYGGEPDFMSAQGYDLGTMIAAAFAGKRNVGPLADSLKSISAYDGITGVISAEISGNFARKFDVVEYRSGNIQPLTAERPMFRQIGEQRVPADNN